MKTLLFVASLIAALVVQSAFAQQGPAGVPGLFGLVDEVLPTPQKKPSEHKPEVQACSKGSSTEQCKVEKAVHVETIKACKGKTGVARRQCLKKQKLIEECKHSSDPALCSRFQKAHELCRNKLGPEHRQCLLNTLIPKK